MVCGIAAARLSRYETVQLRGFVLTGRFVFDAGFGLRMVGDIGLGSSMSLVHVRGSW